MGLNLTIFQQQNSNLSTNSRSGTGMGKLHDINFSAAPVQHHINHIQVFALPQKIIEQL